jgi:hypothetical protein
MKPPEPIARFIVKLNEASVATAIRKKSASSKKTSQGIVKEILAKGKETLDWIKRQL